MGEIKLTDGQLASLATQIGEHMAQHPPVCQVFSGDEISWMKACHSAALKTKSVALATTVGFLVLSFIGILGIGAFAWLKIKLGIKESNP